MVECQTQVDCNVYTDGSKLNGKVRSVVFLLRKTEHERACKVRIPDCFMVYQAKVQAIIEAAKMILDMPNLKTIKFCVDSEAALRTLQSPFIKSKLALQMILTPNEVKHTSMVFVWTKAHVGTEGNESAD